MWQDAKKDIPRIIRKRRISIMQKASVFVRNQGFSVLIFYHYDTPCTITNRIAMLKYAGFYNAEKVFRIKILLYWLPVKAVSLSKYVKIALPAIPSNFSNYHLHIA
jgi:hypothetical protein